ncbi:hypothetical protein EV426DRAFT_449377 [Tirmania nivea]|nr:hypothetical protein EV426DRAFT_449377 [Tirmania nivea]
MTAVATFPSVPRAGSGWPNAPQSSLNQMSPEEVARLFMRKGSQRGVPQSPEGGGVWGNGQIRGGTIGHDTGQTGGVGNLKNKKTTRGAPWPPKGDVLRGPGVGSHSASSSIPSSPTMNGIHQQAPILPSQHRVGQPTPLTGDDNSGTSFLMLQPLNHSFEPKLIPVPYFPNTLRIGRQTNAKTLPNSTNGYFDSKVLSRQHAEVWAEPKTGKVWIRDVKSSNGTFVNGTRLSQENKDSDPHELRAEDILELGIDIFSEDNKSIIHHKVAARVEHAGFQNGQMNLELNNLGDIDPIMGGGLMSPQFKQVNNTFARGRSTSQNSRAGSAAGGAGMMQRGAQVFIQSVSVEQIVKKLNSELHAAKQQAQELQRTQEFFDHLLNLEVVRREPEIKKAEVESAGQSPMIDSGVALDAGQFQNISHRPLPPPAKHITVIPEAEKSEGNGNQLVHDISPPSPVSPPLKRSPKNTLTEPPQHLFSLVAQLRDARLELEAKSLRVKDLEDLLRREREAREMAEAQLQVAAQPTDELRTDNIENKDEDDIPDDVSVANSDTTVIDSKDHVQSKQSDKQSMAAANAATEAAAMWQKKLEEMMAQLKAAQAEIETYKKRVKAAEEEGQKSKRTLMEMVAKIRADEEKKQKDMKETSVQTERKDADGLLRGKPVMVSCGVQVELDQDEDNEGEVFPGAIANATVKAVNGPLVIGGGKQMPNRHRDSNQQQQLQNLSTEMVKKAGEKRSMVKESVPYVSIVGVVVIGVSIMAILNNWPKGER